jgi:hypothetical protein
MPVGSRYTQARCIERRVAEYPVSSGKHQQFILCYFWLFDLLKILIYINKNVLQ